jgi:hypothetical protein
VTEGAATIRPATAEDAAGIAAVHVRSWQVAYRGQLPDALLDSLSVDQRTRWWGEGWWGEDLARRGLVARRRWSCATDAVSDR